MLNVEKFVLKFDFDIKFVKFYTRFYVSEILLNILNKIETYAYDLLLLVQRLLVVHMLGIIQKSHQILIVIDTLRFYYIHIIINVNNFKTRIYYIQTTTYIHDATLNP